MIRTMQKMPKMKANLYYYDENGNSWSVLNRYGEITFSSKRGLIQAITRKVNKDLENGNLLRFFGWGAKVIVKVFREEFENGLTPIATTSVNVY